MQDEAFHPAGAFQEGKADREVQGEELKVQDAYAVGHSA